MVPGVIQGLGGLGLFLLGMGVMTGGLKGLADSRLRGVLGRLTRSPWTGALTGAWITAAIQSSSAVTVAAVGFVDAGLLTFGEALGIIFGANVGTTLTGWIVALVGFKFKLGDATLPLVLVGVLLRLPGNRRLTAIGSAISGFGLCFVGIGILQTGMQSLAEIVTPQTFPGDTLPGRALLLLLGVLITLITQSSSVGVAAALAAVHAQAMSLPQAAAMVIGMDLGTTGSAALATIGGTVRARRTGFAHVIFNCMTAIGAFLLLTPYLSSVDLIWPGASARNPEFILVGFHSFFNLLGALVVLPVTDRFAALIARLIPERGNPLTRRLDPTLLSTPAVALHAVSATLLDLFRTLAGMTSVALEETETSADILDDFPDAEEAIAATRDYLQKLTIPRDTPEQLSGYLAAMHILDHLRRLCRRLREAPRKSMEIQRDHDLRQQAELLKTHAEDLARAGRLDDKETRERLHALNASLKSGMRAFRRKAVRLTAERVLSTSVALARMDAARWLRRIGYHYWRIAFHMGQEELVLGMPAPTTDHVAPVQQRPDL